VGLLAACGQTLQFDLVSDDRTSAEMPTVASVAWTRPPTTRPASVTTPMPRPYRTTWRVTRAKSTPGTTMMMTLAVMKPNNCTSRCGTCSILSGAAEEGSARR
jgi:hypothetical protein